MSPWPTTPTGKKSTAGAHLKRLRHPAIEIKVKLDTLDKRLSSFGDSLRRKVDPITSRVYGDFRAAATIAGRYSCRDPNLQQLPRSSDRDFRKIIAAAPGHVFVIGDYNQVEVRACAEIVNCLAMKADLIAGRDIHREMAAAIARIPSEQVSKEQRDKAKALVFGAIYGGGAGKLAESILDGLGIVMSEAEVQAALDLFFTKYPIRAWQQRHADLCQARGWVMVPTSGRRIAAAWVPGGHLSFPQCCNLVVQGAAADLMLRAVPLVDTRLPDTLVASVHDELLLEVLEQNAEEAARILSEIMVEAFATTFPNAPLRGVVDVGIGKTWAAAKP
jgi:DNA polymerase-1